MDFDLVAPLYQYLEHAAFGNQLQRHRIHFLDQVKDARFALVLGDGDGRFLEQLLAANPAIQVDSVDMSHRMTSIARERICRRFGQSGCERLRFVVQDARSAQFPHSGYDLIAAHFFLDCFAEQELAELVKRVAKLSTPGATWLISEFRQPLTGFAALHAKLWLQAMYKFFRATAALGAKKLPDYRPMMRANGFILIEEHRSRFQLIVSELWRDERAPYAPPPR